jgi:hypothetical protein
MFPGIFDPDWAQVQQQLKQLTAELEWAYLTAFDDQRVIRIHRVTGAVEQLDTDDERQVLLWMPQDMGNPADYRTSTNADYHAADADNSRGGERT